MTQTLKIREVAKILQMCPRTIQRHVSKGTIPPPLRIGHSVRWRESDIQQFLSRPILVAPSTPGDISNGNTAHDSTDSASQA